MSTVIPTLKFLILCDAANSDVSGKLNILGIFTKINVQNLPGGALKFVVVGQLKGIPNHKEYKIDIAVIDPKNIPLKHQDPLALRIPKQNAKEGVSEVNFIVDVIALQFTSYGIHKIVVKIDDKEVGFTEILVEKPNNNV